jgi:phosphoglycolate phosphatase
MARVSPTRLVVFDCDGTLVDSQHVIVEAMNTAFRSHSLQEPDATSTRRTVGLSLAEAIVRLLPDGSQNHLDVVVDAYKDASVALRSQPGHEEPLYPGVVNVLEMLLEQEFKLGVATGKSRRGLIATLERHGLSDHFVTLKTADDGPGKPNPDILNDAMAETGAAPESTIMIGDTTFDITMVVRALMAGLNGKTQVAMGAGRMKSTAIDTFVGGPAKILTELFVSKQSEYTVINCVVSQFDITNGLATSKALLFDTDYATISGKGTINLGTEAFDMEVDPQPKSATINTAIPIVLTGTLASPSYGVNKLAAARKVGGILGAIVFSPALVVGLLETGTGEDNPCAKGAKGAPASKELMPAAKEEASPLKAIEKGIGNPLKKLFGN